MFNCTLFTQVEHMLETEDYGKDLATVQNLVKKHQLLEADVEAHEVSTIHLNIESSPIYKLNLKYCRYPCQMLLLLLKRLNQAISL